jgi:hypothetical protein
VAAIRVGASGLRSRPGRAVLVVFGIAVAIGMLVAVLGASLVAEDRAVQRSIARLPSSERSFRVDLVGLLGEQSYADSDRVARRALAALSPAKPLRVVYFRDSWLDGEFVRLVAADGLARVVRLRSGRLPRTCRPAACEVVQIGNRGRPVLREGGVNLVRVGIGDLRDVSAYGPAFAGLTKLRAQASLVTSTILLPASATSFQHVPALQLLFQVRNWIAPLDTSAIHSWQIEDLLARESRVQADLEQADLAYGFSGPDTALLDARAAGRASAQRMALIGGGVSTLLLGFALVVAISLRRGLGADRQRLLLRGATRRQVWLALLVQMGAITTAGWIAGVVAGVLVVAVLAHAAGLSAGVVLAHALLGRWSLLALLLAWAISTALVLVTVSTRDAGGTGRRITRLDLAAVGAAAAAAVGLARGGLDADALASGADRTLLLLLPGLVCFAGAVFAARLFHPVMLLGERLSRRGPIAIRLALIALARAPSRTLATVAFLVVAVGLALFAAGYRATLNRQAGDQAAFAVPLDLTLSQGPKLALPLDAAPLRRYQQLGPSVNAYPILRRSAAVPGLGSSAQSMTVLGVPPAAFAGMHWRSDFSSTGRSELVRALAADGPASPRGVHLPDGPLELTLPVQVHGAPLRVDLAVRDARGRTTAVPMGVTKQGRSELTARLGPGSGRELAGLELALPGDERDWFFHNDIEGRLVAAPAGTLTLGRLRGPSGTLVSWRGWVVRGRGARLRQGSRVRVTYSFPEIETLVVRPSQPTDGHPLRVVVSPDVARTAGPSGRLTLDFEDAHLPALIVGVAHRFPTVTGDLPFAVVDESRLATALDADAPGTGTPGELWLSVPGRFGAAVDAELARPPLSGLAAASRRQLLDEARHDPLARAVVHTLDAAAFVAAALALLGFGIALLSELRDERSNFFDLEAQGVSPETLLTHLRIRALALVFFGLAGGCVLGLILSRLVVSLVQLTAQTSSPEPPLVFDPGWAVLLPALAVLLAAGLGAAELGARVAFRGEIPRRASWSFE